MKEKNEHPKPTSEMSAEDYVQAILRYGDIEEKKFQTNDLSELVDEQKSK